MVEAMVEAATGARETANQTPMKPYLAADRFAKPAIWAP